MDRKVLTNQIAFTGANFDLFTSLGSIPVRVLRNIQVAVLLLALILLRPEATELCKVLFMMAMGSFEHDKTPIFRSIRCQICNALV